MKCWAFSPPGGLISNSLVGFMEEFCISVVVGKDAVPRMSVNNLNRLMDEMVTSLARCRLAPPFTRSVNASKPAMLTTQAA